jgi:hypothetical protein
MSVNKNIKLKDKNIDKALKILLNIKDSHISFPKEAASKERVHGKLANVFTGFLSYEPPLLSSAFPYILLPGFTSSASH